MAREDAEGEVLLVRFLQSRRAALDSVRVPITTRTHDAVILGAPILLIALSLAHGLDWVMMHGLDDENYDAFIQYIVDIRGRWLAVHLAGLAIFPLVGVAVWWMLPPDRLASRISQLALAPYMVLYAGFDAVAGIGTAIVAGYREGLPAEQRPIAEGIMWSLMGESDPAFYLAEVASYAWAVGVAAAAVALLQERRWRVAVPLALGGAVFFHSHFPPFGAIAGVMLALASWQFFATRNVSQG
jgi:hypothetical protein